MGLFAAALSQEHSFSRTYGVFLPSSLATVLSLTLGYSPCPPVSVLVRAVIQFAPEAFLGSWPHVLRYLLARSLTFHVLHLAYAFHCKPAAPLRPKSIHRVTLAFSVTPSLALRVQEYLPVFHSRLTQGGRTFPWNPWAFGVQDSHLHLATHTGILSSMLSTVPSGTASTCMQRSPTIPQNPQLRYHA